MHNRKLNIVLFEPEIPDNTGNISRNCVGFNATLHMIRPYGFILDDKRVKRAGLDYWQHLQMIQYDDWTDFENRNNIKKESQNIFLITKYAKKEISQLTNIKDVCNSYDNVYFVFGKESKGLPKNIMDKFENNQLRINMNKNIRSFNLSNCAAIVSYLFHFLTNYQYI